MHSFILTSVFFHTEESLNLLTVNDKYYDITNEGMRLW